MTRKISPSVEAQAAAAVAAGWPIVSIAEQTGLSVSTIKRIKQRTGARAGSLREELIADARQSLRDALTADFAAVEAARLVRAQVTICDAIQTRMAELLEHIQICDESDPLRVARTLSAISTAAKLSADSLRQTLLLAAEPENVQELPELIVRELSAAEEDEIRAARDATEHEWAIPETTD